MSFVRGNGFIPSPLISSSLGGDSEFVQVEIHLLIENEARTKKKAERESMNEGGKKMRELGRGE